MAAQVFMSVFYMLPRTILWMAVFIFALIDGIRHAYENARARKLYIGVVVVLGVMVVQDVLLTLYSFTTDASSSTNVLFKIYIFFTDAADSLFAVRSSLHILSLRACAVLS